MNPPASTGPRSEVVLSLIGNTPLAPLFFEPEGVTDGFVPPLPQDAPIDSEIKIRSADAQAMAVRLQRQFGLLVGTSFGANVAAALSVAIDPGPQARVVTLLCDRAERYFSTRLFSGAAPVISGPRHEPALK